MRSRSDLFLGRYSYPPGPRSNRLAHRNLARPAVPAQHLADALKRVADVEQPADQRFDTHQRPALAISEPVRQRARRSSAPSRAHCWGDNRSRDTGPLDFNAPSPPSAQARRHRRTEPGVTRRSRAISLTLSPAANRPAA